MRGIADKIWSTGVGFLQIAFHCVATVLHILQCVELTRELDKLGYKEPNLGDPACIEKVRSVLIGGVHSGERYCDLLTTEDGLRYTHLNSALVFHGIRSGFSIIGVLGGILLIWAVKKSQVAALQWWLLIEGVILGTFLFFGMGIGITRAFGVLYWIYYVVAALICVASMFIVSKHKNSLPIVPLDTSEACTPFETSPI